MISREQAKAEVEELNTIILDDKILLAADCASLVESRIFFSWEML